MMMKADSGKPRQLEIDASEARLRSERRLGELMKDMPKVANHHRKATGAQSAPVESLLDCAIDKHLAKSARAAAAISDATFEKILDTHR